MAMIYQIKSRQDWDPGLSQEELREIVFPIQQVQQIVFANIQDGARGDDLRNQEKTQFLDFFQEDPRENDLS